MTARRVKRLVTISKDCRLAQFDLETWDHGKLIVNRTFAALLRRHDWTTFDAVWAGTANAEVAKKLRTDRVTLRFTLSDGPVERAFYVKRHGPSAWIEYIKPLLRLTWPILGARNEWQALLDFHHADLPTMTPVAIGESGGQSFLITESLENCTKLSRLNPADESGVNSPVATRTQIVTQVAEIARKMHQAGLHHQDFYLGHLLLSPTQPAKIYVIDLGRVQKHKRLSRRWIVKDLAQLNFSATSASIREHLLFMRVYLGRPVTRANRQLIDQIESKSRSIARHSVKNRL